MTRRELGEHDVLALDADHVDAAIGEREGERQANPPQADHRDALRSHYARPARLWARYWRVMPSTKRGFV